MAREDGIIQKPTEVPSDISSEGMVSVDWRGVKRATEFKLGSSERLGRIQLWPGHDPPTWAEFHRGFSGGTEGQSGHYGAAPVAGVGLRCTG